MKKIGIVGSRRRNSPEDYAQIEKEFLKIYDKGDSIVSGGCPIGADRFAEMIRDKFSIPMKIYYPDKTKLDPELMKHNPRGAYAIINFARNTLIAENCDVLLAQVAEDRTGGTEDTIKKTTKLNKPVILLHKQNDLLF